MASKNFVIQYTIKAKNAFSKQAAKVAKSSRAMVKQTKKVSTGFKNASRSSKKAAAGINKSSFSFSGAAKRFAVIAAVVGSIGVAFSKVISRGRKFETAIADLSAITGASGSDLQNYSNEAIRLAKSSIISSDQVANAIKQIASAKSELLKDPRGLIRVTEQALLLANASGIDIPDAVRASVGSLNQFGQGADQAARFVNVLAAGAKVGASEIGNTAEALKNAGSVAAQFNISFEKTNALIQVLAKNEIKGAEAGTALRSTLSKLEGFMGGKFAPSKIGIIKSLAAIEKLGLSNTQIIKKFGNENLRTILILKKNVPLLKKWAKEITGTNSAQEQANKRLKTGGKLSAKLGIVINTKLIAAYASISSVIDRLTQTTIRLFDSLSPEAINILISPLKLLLVIISALLDVLMGVFTIFKGIVQTVAQFTAAMASLDFSGFDLLKNFSIGGDFLGVSGLNDLFGIENKSQTDVNLNVGLAGGLEQKGGASVTQTGRPANVGLNAAGA